MNWLSIINFVVKNAPGIINIINELIASLKQTTAPKGGLRAIDDDDDDEQPAKVTRGPSETVKAVQKLLNEFVKPKPALKEDGWMGEKTEAAIRDALEMAKPYLAMLGK